MNKIKLVEGMKFINKNGDNEDMFEVKKWHFYEELNKDVYCAFTKDGYILPLNEVALEEYFPIIDGKVFNEDYELEY